MEEIKKVDRRVVFSVYETDRNSKESLAKTYQIIAKPVPQVPCQLTGVLDVVSTIQKSAFVLEAVS